jgi:UDP-glucose 4-epimerase
MNVLVTGGAGYVGSVTTEALLARGPPGGGRRRPAHRSPRRRARRRRLRPRRRRRPELVGYALEEHDVEAILHFAASSLVGESMQAPLDYFDNNVTGALRLWRTALRHGVKRVVVSSTAALYGTPDAVPIPETARLAPESVYGETKLQLERALPGSPAPRAWGRSRCATSTPPAPRPRSARTTAPSRT